MTYELEEDHDSLVDFYMGAYSEEVRKIKLERQAHRACVAHIEEPGFESPCDDDLVDYMDDWESDWILEKEKEDES